MPQVDVPGKRVDLLAVDQNLHALYRRKIRRQRVDDGVDREELVERSASVVRSRVSAVRCEWRGEGETRRIVTVVTFAIDETIVGTTAAVTISRPPIVGVPALARCDCGPSWRMICPI